MSLGREWRCSCGAWIPYAYGRHPHVKARSQSLEEMVQARLGNEIAPLYEAVEITHEWRTPEHAVREIQ
jgi:hypothetical protein